VFVVCVLAASLVLILHRGSRSLSVIVRKPNVSSQHATLVWEADFAGPSGTPPSTQQWDVVQGGGGWGHHELQTYDSGEHTVGLTGSGFLSITAQRFTAPSTGTVTYSSGRVQSGAFSLSSALVTARLRTPPGQGLWPAFWLESYGSEHPVPVELDAMEAIGRRPDTAFGTAHFGTLKRSAGLTLAQPLSDSFHVYAVEWTPRLIRFFFDGRPYATVMRSSLPSRAAWPSDLSMHIILNLAVGGDWPGPPSQTTPFPAHMLVAWVRVYRLSSTG
jgi:beta-glucanase (GH16 family)